MTLRISAVAAALALAACATTPDKTPPSVKLPPTETAPRTDGQKPRSGAKFIVAGDSQFNNMYGAPLAIGSIHADAIARVAIRPPQLDYWAPTVLAELLGRAKKTGATDLLFLGDVANISCVNEFDRFTAVVRKAGLNAIVVPGNHDSLLFGNGSWELRDANTNALQQNPDRVNLRSPFADSSTPVDRALIAIHNVLARFGHGTFVPWFTWADACQVATETTALGGTYVGDNQAMNKRAFLERYSAFLLERTGRARMNEEATADPVCGRRMSWSIQGGEEDVLKEAQFVVCENAPAQSYTLQFLRFGAMDVAALDTTTYEAAELRGAYNVNTYPGSHAGHVEELLPHIREYYRKQNVRTFLLAGHHHLAEWSEEGRNALSGTPAVLAYLSAHTHHGFDGVSYFESRGDKEGATQHRLPELNIGSTTDWPMELGVLNVDQKSGNSFELSLQLERFHARECDVSARAPLQYGSYGTRTEYFARLMETLQANAAELGLDEEDRAAVVAVQKDAPLETRLKSQMVLLQKLQQKHGQSEAWHLAGACQARWASEAERETPDIPSGSFTRQPAPYFSPRPSEYVLVVNPAP